MYQDSFKLVASTKIKDFYPPDLEKMFDQPQIELLINNQKMESIKVNKVNKIIKEGENMMGMSKRMFEKGKMMAP